MTVSYALLLGAFLLALLQCSVPLVSLYYQHLSWLKWVKLVTWLQFAWVLLTFLSLAYAFLINDFSFAYVAQNSNTHLPCIYRLCAILGGREGSILLRVFILNLWTVAVIVLEQSMDPVAILLGTLYPLIIEVLGLGKLSAGAPYFNLVCAPFAVLDNDLLLVEFGL